MKRLWDNTFFRHIVYWISAYSAIFISVFLYERVEVGLQVATMIILPAPLPVYLHFYVLEKFFVNRKYWSYTASLTVIIFVSGLLGEYIFDIFFGQPGSHTSGYIMAFFYIIITTALKYFSEILRNKYRIQEIEFKQLQTEMSLLKSQVNPHFFFNTLNNLYALSLAKSEEVPTVILKLSNLMRYVLETSKQKFVALDKEIEFINNYIELEKLRLEQNSNVNFNVNGKTDNVIIAPMLLMPFVENSFKHGLNASSNGGFVEINIDIFDKYFEFVIVNSEPAQEIGNKDSSKLGLTNVKRRLELIYPDKHKLSIEDKNDTFSVKLKIDL